MGNFRIYQDNYADFTVVSNRFIDEFMQDANDAQLKIYLYLIRMLGADLATGISDISDRFNYTEKDVMKALRFWEEKKVISLQYDRSGVLVGVHMLPLGEDRPKPDAVPETGAVTSERGADTSGHVSIQPLIQVQAPQPAPALKIVQTPEAGVRDYRDRDKPQYSKDDLGSFMARGSQLVFVAESYLRRTLSQADLSTLLFISDTLCFSDDLIDYLLQYCVERGKTAHRYIEKVARDWADSDIHTPDDAAAYVSRYDSAYSIMRALGKNNTDPTPVELDLIGKWTREYGFDTDIIFEACARTVLATDRSRFRYADSILTRWHELGIRSKADIDKMDVPKKKAAASGNGSTNQKKFNQFPQNTYDYDELERKLITN